MTNKTRKKITTRKKRIDFSCLGIDWTGFPEDCWGCEELENDFQLSTMVFHHNSMTGENLDYLKVEEGDWELDMGTGCGWFRYPFPVKKKS